jgi:formylglycine-generating enzyme required for sulfatase activity
MFEIAAQQDASGARTSYGSTIICMRQDQHLAKLVPFKVTGRCSSEIVEPTLRVVIAFLLLLLFQLSGPEAQQKGSRVGEVAGPKDAFRDCAVCPEMVVVPAGEFMMGSPPSERGRNPDEGPQRKVIFAQPFAAGKYEVTLAEWDACVAEAGCTRTPHDNDWGRGKRPVINVSWNDAQQFVGWLAKKTGKPYRLMTEAEWEYAARGSAKAIDRPPPFSTGATINPNQANYDGNFVYGAGPKMGIYRQKTLDVGSFKPNAFGLYDMHGNVWEWVEDCYQDSYAGAPTDGSAVKASSCKLNILRGGAWNYYPQLLRSAYRYASAPSVHMENAGFRVARSM